MNTTNELHNYQLQISLIHSKISEIIGQLEGLKYMYWDKEKFDVANTKIISAIDLLKDLR
jgi:hypothetical protein